jgi:iron complex transport system ATP-binding protein
MSIVVERLSFRFGRRRVLTEIEAAALPGRVTAVVGPNAAGKSTLLRCVIGALGPQSGQVLVDGQPVRRLSATERASRIAYVPQRAVVSAAFSARQVVELGRYALAPDRRRVDEALEWLDVHDVQADPFRTLSMGQQQRVSLARAAAQLQPRGALVLDEPVSALDIGHVHAVMRLLRRLADHGATVIVALHDLTLAVSLADDAWLLRSGRLVAAGLAERVLAPERLESVFGVRFEQVRDSAGGTALIAEAWTRFD